MATRAVRDRLQDVLVAIANIEADTAVLDWTGYLADRRTRDAVERNLERISEASRHIPSEIKARYTAIPWHDIAAIGNILRHQYEGVSDHLVWHVIEKDLPTLKSAVLRIVKDLPDD
jgi:uncharacterized protein with HEPN domain